MKASRLVRACLLSLGIVVMGFAVLFMARLSTEQRFVAQLGPLTPSAYTRPQVRSDANAARYFLAAASKLKLTQEQAQLLASWNPAEGDGGSAALFSLVGQSQASMRLALQGAGLKESFYGLDYSGGFQARLPDLPKLVALGKLLVLKASLARRRGEVERTIVALGALGSLAESLQREPGFSPFSAGLLLERWQLLGVAQALAEPGFPGRRATELVAGLSGEDVVKGFARVVGLEEASLRLALPSQHGWTAFLADQWFRLRSCQRALALAGLASKPVALWQQRFGESGLANHEFRLLAVLAQGQGVLASRLLVNAALLCAGHAAQHGELPKTLGLLPDATRPLTFSGEVIVYRPSSGCLELPQGERLWQQLHLPEPSPPFAICLGRAAQR